MGFKSGFVKICLNKKGLSLLELLIAISLFTFGLLGSTALTVTVIKGNHLAKKVTEATILAQDKVEELKRLSYTDSQLAAGDHPNDLAGTDWDYYTREWNVQDDIPTQDMKTITVTVNWTDTSIHEVRLETIRAR